MQCKIFLCIHLNEIVLFQKLFSKDFGPEAKNGERRKKLTQWREKAASVPALTAAASNLFFFFWSNIKILNSFIFLCSHLHLGNCLLYNDVYSFENS